MQKESRSGARLVSNSGGGAVFRNQTNDRTQNFRVPTFAAGEAAGLDAPPSATTITYSLQIFFGEYELVLSHFCPMSVRTYGCILHSRVLGWYGGKK